MHPKSIFGHRKLKILQKNNFDIKIDVKIEKSICQSKHRLRGQNLFLQTFIKFRCSDIEQLILDA